MTLARERLGLALPISFILGWLILCSAAAQFAPHLLQTTVFSSFGVIGLGFSVLALHQYGRAGLARLARARAIAPGVDSQLVEPAACTELEEAVHGAEPVAGHLAHELNNILTIIEGHTSLLLETERPAPGSEMFVSLREIHGAAERATRLATHLQMFSRGEWISPGAVDLNGTIERNAARLREILGGRITLHLRLAHELPIVSADPYWIQQLLSDLAIRARSVMPAGGVLEVRTEPRRGDDGSGMAGLIVSDSSQFQLASNQAEFFKPFCARDVPAKGGGFGLASVVAIAQRHQGSARYSASQTGGSMLEISLPLHS